LQLSTPPLTGPQPGPRVELAPVTVNPAGTFTVTATFCAGVSSGDDAFRTNVTPAPTGA
jgi:hypothetical protein